MTQNIAQIQAKVGNHEDDFNQIIYFSKNKFN